MKYYKKLIEYIKKLFSKKEKVKWKPQEPFTWWIDDLSHSVCALMDDPERGFNKIQWPDDEYVYIAIDKSFHDKKVAELENRIKELETSLKHVLRE